MHGECKSVFLPLRSSANPTAAYTRRTYTQLKQNHGAEGRGAHLLIRPQPEPEQIFHAPAVSLPALRTLRH